MKKPRIVSNVRLRGKAGHRKGQLGQGQCIAAGEPTAGMRPLLHLDIGNIFRHLLSVSFPISPSGILISFMTAYRSKGYRCLIDAFRARLCKQADVVRSPSKKVVGRAADISTLGTSLEQPAHHRANRFRIPVFKALILVESAYEAQCISHPALRLRQIAVPAHRRRRHGFQRVAAVFFYGFQQRH